jgi:hypothetical protein
MDDRQLMRVSDADRQVAADRLRSAMDEGRLDLLEYDTRLATAYSAVTYGDLDELFTDLPQQAGQALAPSGRRPREVPAVWSPAPLTDQGFFARMPTALKVLWTIWVAVLSINLTVWLLVSVSSGEPVYFWPMWLLVPGAPLPGITVGVMAMRKNREERRQALPPQYGSGGAALD